MRVGVLVFPDLASNTKYLFCSSIPFHSLIPIEYLKNSIKYLINSKSSMLSHTDCLHFGFPQQMMAQVTHMLVQLIQIQNFL